MPTFDLSFSNQCPPLTPVILINAHLWNLRLLMHTLWSVYTDLINCDWPPWCPREWWCTVACSATGQLLWRARGHFHSGTEREVQSSTLIIDLWYHIWGVNQKQSQSKLFAGLPYSRKLSREKTFANFADLCSAMKVFSVNFLGRGMHVNGHTHADWLDCSTKVFFVKSSFLPIRESLLPRNFSAVRYINLFHIFRFPLHQGYHGYLCLQFPLWKDVHWLTNHCDK